jgi:predicted RNA methylase
MEFLFKGKKIWLKNRDGQIPAQPHSVSLIDELARPQNLGTVIDQIASRSQSPQLTDITPELRKEAERLCLHGFLIEHGLHDPQFEIEIGSFDAAESHLRMLKDQTRTLAFKKALEEKIEPDSVVLDIGTGTGVLAAFAARAGAKHVYAIERSPIMASLARKFFEANGLSSRITVVEGTSTSVQIPEKVDCIVGEIIGNDPLSERIVSLFHDARTRFGNCQCSLIPNKITLLAVPINQSLNKHIQETRNWIHPQKLSPDMALGDPAEIIQIDLSQNLAESVDKEFDLKFTDHGLLEALALCFTLELSPSVSLSTVPGSAGSDNHWMSLLWKMSEPLRVEPGHSVTHRYIFDKFNHSYFETI